MFRPIARLVAKGFKQIHGIDYDETFSLVAMVKSIRILLAIAAFLDYEIWQMDVKTAFLNGSLEEDVYMTQPEGFVDPRNAGKVCKLRRSIYGLKQSSRRWNIRFDDIVTEYGFVQNEAEPCVYKEVSGSYVAFIVLYVDDILLMGNDIPSLKAVKTWLGSNISMKYLGEASYILGMRIYRERSRRMIGLSQSTYIDKVSFNNFKSEPIIINSRGNSARENSSARGNSSAQGFIQVVVPSYYGQKYKLKELTWNAYDRSQIRATWMNTLKIDMICREQLRLDI
ncbi:hypothetical protein AgCh_032122 [Apium graveolens]